jgi:GNAT superfamily N-acetyltransferase
MDGPGLATLPDGATVVLRPIQPSDAEALERFHEALSPNTTRLRFFAPHPHLSPSEVARFTNVDHDSREAFVALSGDDIVGVARYDRFDETDAEVAFVVADAWQGRGLGTVLLDHLADQASSAGVKRFVADTLAENRTMLHLFARRGLSGVPSWDCGVAHVVVPLAAPTDAQPEPGADRAMKSRRRSNGDNHQATESALSDQQR